uniref:Uncharacterized protein n=1 Tax=Arion vulgaris TaxID=1028688 RepID=A0A0B7B0Y0_9EUPU
MLDNGDIRNKTLRKIVVKTLNTFIEHLTITVWAFGHNESHKSAARTYFMRTPGYRQEEAPEIDD